MTMYVPWLPKRAIEQKAREMTSRYGEIVGRKIEPPIPVEDIIERYLELRLCFEDLEAELGQREILGALYINARKVVINTQLTEGESEGRLCFTCGHEVGHWTLHRHFISEAVRRTGTSDMIVCRRSNAHELLEWQANYFSACLLMPRTHMMKAFRAVCGSEPLVLENEKSKLGGTWLNVDPCVANWHYIADMVRKAGNFDNVSKEAMAIRLQELGLMVNMTGKKIGW